MLDYSPGPNCLYLVARRIWDIVASAALIWLALPLMSILAIAIAATSPGPVLFRQTRLGKGCVPFVLYKFRSMYANVSDDDVHNTIDRRPAARRSGTRVERRLSPIGEFIRRTSLDELPQLFNVLKGDMSFVGPRPLLASEAATCDPAHLKQMLEVKPGITGLWQVEGRRRDPR